VIEHRRYQAMRLPLGCAVVEVDGASVNS